MSISTTVRLVERNDLESVIVLLQNISSFFPPRDSFDDIWQGFTSQENNFSFIAEEGSHVIGYGSILIETKIRGGKLGHIEDIVVAQDYRRRGIGKVLLETLYTLALDHGCYKVSLHCQSHNSDFYEKCGYIPSGSALQRFIPNKF